MKKDSKSVHQRRTRFIKEFLIDQNATRAARAAGYSEKTSYAQGHRLLKDAEVIRKIEEGNTKVNDRLDISVERIKLELARLAYYDPRKYWNADGSAKPLVELDEDSARAIGGFEMAELFTGNGEERGLAGYVKKFKLADKTKALEMLGRHLKMFTDKIEFSAADGVIQKLQAARQRTKKAS